MSESKEVIIATLDNYIVKWDTTYSNWYVGIASDPKDRLFNDHNVNEKPGIWIFQECENDSVARDIEKYFVDTMKTKGGSGGGDEDSIYVYAYKITSTTKENN